MTFIFYISLIVIYCVGGGVSATAGTPPNYDRAQITPAAEAPGNKEAADSLSNRDMPSESGILSVLESLTEMQGEEEETVSDGGDVIFDLPGQLSVVDGALSVVTSLGALDFVEDVYESNDFYESGYWGKDGMTFNSDVYSGTLPAYSEKDFIRPARGRITSVFGYREAYHRYHKGVDIAVKVGAEVKAALPGVVGRIGYEPGGYGHFVVVAHSNGVETRYAHLSKVTATLGQKVAAGDVIALGGNTGNSTGPHLHFELRYRGRAVDPLSLFRF